MTLQQFSKVLPSIPTATTWYLADLAEAKGRQDLYTRQSPQRLKALREHALIESAVSSNRIEGVEVEPDRVKPVVLGAGPLRDRNEEEIRGYRKALKLIHERGANLPLLESTILELHRLSRGDVWDAGKYKDKNSDIIEKSADGRQRVRFKTVTASRTPASMRRLLTMWDECLRDRWIQPLAGLAGFNLDFLCIHPFRDGNGRVSRLLLLLQCYHLGFEVGRYVSIEKLIEDNKDRYYETLEQSSHAWHDGKHDPWPYINYVLFILKSAYVGFESRVGQTASPRGTKTQLVLDAIHQLDGEFKLVDIERACPGVGRDWIRVLLAELKKAGEAECRGKGPSARWRYVGSKGTTSK